VTAFGSVNLGRWSHQMVKRNRHMINFSNTIFLHTKCIFGTRK